MPYQRIEGYCGVCGTEGRSCQPDKQPIKSKINGGTAGAISFAANYETFKAINEEAERRKMTVSALTREIVRNYFVMQGVPIP